MVTASRRPRRFPGLPAGRVPPWPALVLAMILALGAWAATEAHWRALTHPRHPEMLRAAQTMLAAMQVIHREKAERGLLQPETADPNRTGLIGPEWSEITTSLGILDAKRTATNPDLAAAVLRALVPLDLLPGDVAIVVLSGSLPGASLAALSALETLRVRPVVVSSVSGSMYGAIDPEFTWLDMEAALRARGVLRSGSALAVLGGVRGIGRGMSDEGLAMLRAAIARHDVPLLEADPLDRLVASVLERAVAEAGGLAAVRLLVNAGGATVALGTCPESASIPAGLSREPLSCSDGTAGLAMRLSQSGVPILNLLNMRRLSVDWGLPYDPVPLPPIGNNSRIYGGGAAGASRSRGRGARPPRPRA